MAKAFAPKVLTANHLLEGDVIYRDADGGWTRVHADALLLTEEGEAEAALAHALDEQGSVVGPYLADAQAGENGPEPVHFREAFRTRGPSNYHHGKQAERGHVQVQ